MRTSRRAGENALVNDMVTGWRSGRGVNVVSGLAWQPRVVAFTVSTFSIATSAQLIRYCLSSDITVYFTWAEDFSRETQLMKWCAAAGQPKN
jgi:hypothetical protein